MTSIGWFHVANGEAEDLIEGTECFSLALAFMVGMDDSKSRANPFCNQKLVLGLY